MLTNSKCSLYADDTCLYITGKHIDLIEMQLQEDLLNVEQWLRAYRLSVNVNKYVDLDPVASNKLKNEQHIS